MPHHGQTAVKGIKLTHHTAGLFLFNRELCTTKYHCAECHHSMNFTKYEKIKTKERDTNERARCFLAGEARTQGPNCSILIWALYRARVSCEHQWLRTLKTQWGVLDWKTVIGSILVISLGKHMNVVSVHGKLRMSELEISLHSRCANALTAI